MLVPALLAFGIAFACLCLLVCAPMRHLALDRPNPRSLHSVPIPRTGGLALVAGVAGALALSGSREQAPLAIGIVLAAISFCDDLFGLPSVLRLVIHLAAATAIVTISLPDAAPIVQCLLVLGIAWFINLYNFMDGSDGLAAGMTIVGFGAFAIAAHSAGVVWLASACVAAASAAVAFLIFNFPPARIFMGDSGSIAAGFLAGATAVAGWHADAWAPWFPIVVFSPFIADATLTLAKRCLRGDKVWLAHREHYYQRVVRMGMGHRNTALAWYALMVASAGVALGVRDASVSAQWASLAGCLAAYGLLALWIDRRWSRHAKAQPG